MDFTLFVALNFLLLIRPEDLTTQVLAPNAVPAGAIAATQEGRLSVAGALLRRSYQPNEPLIAGTMLQTTDRGFLATVLAPGTRAVSVAVDPVLSGGGLVWPGDHVDMLLTAYVDFCGRRPEFVFFQPV